jgi:hypothetical protein
MSPRGGREIGFGYLDRLPVFELRVQHRELEQEPLVQVDILDDGGGSR